MKKRNNLIFVLFMILSLTFLVGCKKETVLYELNEDGKSYSAYCLNTAKEKSSYIV